MPLLELKSILRNFRATHWWFATLLGAYGLYAFSGRADHHAARVAICERHAAHYGEDWWFLMYLGWSYTEAGNVAHGRSLTERALRLRRQNALGAHAFAHALFEQGDTATLLDSAAACPPLIPNSALRTGTTADAENHSDIVNTSHAARTLRLPALESV